MYMGVTTWMYIYIRHVHVDLYGTGDILLYWEETKP